jgi:hypothetical protein
MSQKSSQKHDLPSHYHSIKVLSMWLIGMGDNAGVETAGQTQLLGASQFLGRWVLFAEPV